MLGFVLPAAILIIIKWCGADFNPAWLLVAMMGGSFAGIIVSICLGAQYKGGCEL